MIIRHLHKYETSFKSIRLLNREGKLNLSTSGGSDLNQELVENSDYTKSTSESGMMNNDGVESSGMFKSNNKMTGESSSKPNSTSMMGQNEENDDNKKAEESENSIANYKVSDMNSRMGVNAEKDNKSEGNSEPSLKENTLTKSDVPYDVPNDQTPRMSDMPKNYDNYSKKGDNTEPANE